MKVIPVLDILNGLAVHAVRGLRSEYQPLKSVLCNSTEPIDIALAFENFGFTELYVADLDAISGKNQVFSKVKQIAGGTGLRLMVDAGVSNLARAEELLRRGASKVIVGTETLSTVGFVEETIRFLGKERVVVSIDMKNGQLLGRFNVGKPANPLELLKAFQDMGLGEVILLDLARVGSQEGVNTAFLEEVLKELDLKVLVGGGVRYLKDLLELKDMGVSGVLLATALHSGAVKVEELVRSGLDL